MMNQAAARLALCTLLGWPIFMFSYLHDRMHVANFWMTRIPQLKIWFLDARRPHDIHHRSVDEGGRMDTNFGIGFYFFDRLFRTIANRHGPFNWIGYQSSVERYGLKSYSTFLSGVSKQEFVPELSKK